MGVFILSIILMLTGVFMLHYIRRTNLEIRRYQQRYKRCLVAYEKQFWAMNRGEPYQPHGSWDEAPRNPIEAHEKNSLAEIYEDTVRQGEKKLMLELWNTAMTQYYEKMGAGVAEPLVEEGSAWVESMTGDSVIYNIAARRN